MEFCHWTRFTVGLLLLQNLVFGIEKVRGLICTLCPGSSSQKLAWILVSSIGGSVCVLSTFSMMVSNFLVHLSLLLADVLAVQVKVCLPCPLLCF